MSDRPEEEGQDTAPADAGAVSGGSASRGEGQAHRGGTERGVGEAHAGARGRLALPEEPYLVVGLARSGIAAARALRRRGLTVIGVDSGSPLGARELEQEGVEVRIASDGLGLLERVGSVIKSPGVPGEADVIAEARRRGMTVLGELEMAWRLMENELIAVTGTNGKTTTVELIAHIHREAGLPVALAGNVGLALSALVDRVGPDVPIVCEASSFQLEDTIELAPEVAVLLNLAPDHLDRHGSFAAYAEAKLQVFARQGANGIAVVPEDLSLPDPRPGCELAEQRIRQLGFAGRFVRIGDRRDICVEDRVIRWRGEPLLEAGRMRIRGEHNVQNAMAAAAVCLSRGVEMAAVGAGLESFAGVEHRLEEVASRHGVLYINDSKATNVASTLTALAAVGGGRRVHLILGGQGKGQEFRALRKRVGESCGAVYLIGEDGPAIGEALAGIDTPVHECGEMEAALERASADARRAHAAAGWVAAARAGGRGDPAGQDAEAQVVMLSPACASFDQFESFEDRGRRFKEMVAAL